MAQKSFYIKEITGTDLELCYVTGWVEDGKCSLFSRKKDTTDAIHDFGILTHREASVIWNAVVDKESLLDFYKDSIIAKC